MTNEQLAQLIATLITDFIRPSAQQANANRETLDRVVDLLGRHAEGLLSLEARLDQIEEIVRATAQQQQINTQQQQINTQRLAQFDERLEETRQLVAQNASTSAQNEARHNATIDRIEQQAAQNEARHSATIDRIEQQIEANASTIAQNETRHNAAMDRIEQQAAQNEARHNATIDRIEQQISVLVQENQAFRESQQSQLAAIIGNGRRIDRLEQRAS